jgi:L-lactate dehydrogenase (cytochrome)
MNERFDSQLADEAAEPVASIPAPELRNGRRKATALALHPGQLKSAARRRLPYVIFDYLEGGSNSEVTLRANYADLDALRLNQRVFDHAASRNLRTTLFGERATIPVGLAPVGMGGVFYAHGEIHAARAASAFGVPYCLSTLSSCSMEEVAAAVGAPFLFQLYLFNDRAINASLLQRADQAGSSALMLTLDTAIQGRRNRDIDNGLVVPHKVRPRHVADIARKPCWLYRWLRTKPTLGNLTPYSPDGSDLATVSLWVNTHYKGAVDTADLEWVRQTWPRKLVVKGILDPDDAKLAVKLGADAIVVSNHGGRQLDGASSTARMLPAIRDAVGDDVELILDSGIRSGFDVLKALGLGAHGCLIGRAYVYGLAANGEPGVVAALDCMTQELEEAMMLTGTADVNALPKGLVLG